MKNKKLFAILTLVCFMFTLMPVAAFATETNVSDPYVKMDAKYASVDVNEDAQLKIMIPGGTKATTTFYVFAVNGNALSNKLADADGATDGFTAVTTATNCGFTMLAKDSGATTTSETVNFEFTAPGEYQVYVVKSNNALDAFVDGMDLLTNDIKGTLTRFAIGNPVTVKVAVPEMTYGIEATTVGAYNVETPVTTTAGVTVAADNGFTSATMNFKLKMYTTASQYKWVEGAELNVYTDSHAVNVTKLTAATDVEGGQKFQISATIPGNYNVYVSYGEVTVAYPVNVTAVGSTEVSVLKAPTAPTNVKTATTTTSGIVFQLTDANGYVMKGASDGEIASAAKVTLLSAPAGFDRPGLGYALVWESATTSKVAGWVIAERTLSGTANDRLDEEGTYTFKVALQNGASATASVTVDKFGKAVKAAFANVPESVVFNTTYTLDTTTDLVLVDEKGVTTPLVGSGMAYTLTASGAAVDSFTYSSPNYAMNVAKTSPTPEKFVGSKINMFLVVGSGANAMTATAEMVVSAPAATVDVVDTEVAVGKTVVLKAELKDADGNKIDVAQKDVKVVILDKPANAVVNATPVGTFPASPAVTDDEVLINFIASEAGEYKVQVVVVEDSTNKYITGIETITVGGAHGAFNDVIVMSIGANTMVKNSATVAMPAAPEIKDSRTMVPARAGLEAFGAVVAWDEATQTVTAELNGVKVVMTIGEKAYTVNGKVVVGDAAPYITAASTMVPVSFFTNAFGITATPIYDANGVCDVLFTK